MKTYKIYDALVHEKKEIASRFLAQKAKEENKSTKIVKAVKK